MKTQLFLNTEAEVLIEKEFVLLAYFRDNSKSTQRLSFKELPYSKRKIQTMMNELTKRGYLERMGSRKTGYWKTNF